MNVAILVPLRAGIEDRDRLWTFARARWEADFPDWPIIVGEHNDGPFNRSAAINRAAAQAPTADVFLIIDADVLCDPHAVRSTVDIAQATDGLVIASAERWMLSEQGTRKILAGYTGKWDGLVRQRYGTLDDPRGAQVSCCIAVSRRLWDQVGGFDELHVAYGWEDVSFKRACEVVSGKSVVWLGPHPIYHLHHKPSPDDREGGVYKSANEARARRYLEGDLEAVRALIREHLGARRKAEPPRIPRILHRSVPTETSDEIEGWWAEFGQLHPGWDLRTWRDPLNPADFPLTADLWPRCKSGAQRAGLVRLELLVTHGGFWIDSDCKPFRSLEPLVHNSAIAAWEDEKTVPDAVLAAEPHHPAFELCLEKARSAIEGGADAWNSGPGVTTEVLPNRDDVLLLGPSSFYAVHWLEKARLDEPPAPYEFLRHMWHGSWLSDAHRKSMDRRQRVRE